MNAKQEKRGCPLGNFYRMYLQGSPLYARDVNTLNEQGLIGCPFFDLPVLAWRKIVSFLIKV